MFDNHLMEHYKHCLWIGWLLDTGIVLLPGIGIGIGSQNQIICWTLIRAHQVIAEWHYNHGSSWIKLYVIKLLDQNGFSNFNGR